MSHSIGMLNELNVAKRLILDYYNLGKGILIHIPVLSTNRIYNRQTYSSIYPN